MINWAVVICFVSIVFYLCFCVYNLYDFFNCLKSNDVSTKKSIVFLAIVLGFVVLGLLFLFFVSKMFLSYLR